MASGSALGVNIISDSSFSSSETDSDSDGNVRFSEFDSDSRQRSGSNDDAFLGFGEPADTPVFTWDKSYGPCRSQSLISTIQIPDQPTV